MSDALDQSDLREILDMVAVLRSDSARFTLHALHAVLRPDASRASLRKAAGGITRGLHLIAGKTPVPNRPDEHAAWVRGIAAKTPDAISRMTRFGRRIDEIADTHGPLEVDVIAELAHDGATEFHDDTTALLRALWSDLETRRQQAILTAREAIGAASAAMAVLADAGAEVRLLALNAAIEAGHFGQEAAGFGVIAKAMQNLAADFGDRIARTGEATRKAGDAL